MVRGHTSSISHTLFLHSGVCILDLDAGPVRKLFLEFNPLGGCPSFLLCGGMRRSAGFEKEATRSRTLSPTWRNRLCCAGSSYLFGLDNPRRLERIHHSGGYHHRCTYQLDMDSQSANISTNVTLFWEDFFV